MLDGTFLREPLSSATAKGTVNHKNGWGMHNTHEGENFIPPGLSSCTTEPENPEQGNPGFNSSDASFEVWLRGYLPKLSERSFRLVTERFYPPVGSTETIESYNSTAVRAGLVFRDTVLTCPALWMAHASPERGYLGEYTIAPALHGSDTQYWNRINEIQVEDSLLYEGYAGAMASFFQTGDANAWKLTGGDEPGVPELSGRGKGRGERRRGNEEFVIMEDGFANVGIRQLEERCAFWRNVGEEIDA